MCFPSGVWAFDQESPYPLSIAALPESPVIWFDGRLDNRADLLLRFRELLPPGSATKPSDADLALAVFKRRGTSGFADLIGDWSLILWDSREKKLVMASDFAGVRPLYYCLQPQRVLWSTRLDVLVDHLRPAAVDDDYVAGFLTSGACANRTPYRDTFSIPPGHAVCISRTGVTAEPFWTLPIGSVIRYRREADYEEQLRSLFREAVRCRLREGQTVLAELSGGLDSSSIVCMARHLIECGDAEASKLTTVTCENPGSLDTGFSAAIEKHCEISGIHVSAGDFPFLSQRFTGRSLPAFWESLNGRMAELANQSGATTYITGRMGDLTMGNWGDDSDQVAGLLRQGRIGSAFRQAVAWSKIRRVPIYWVFADALRLNLPATLVANRLRRPERSAVPSSEEDSLSPDFRQRVIAARHAFVSDRWTTAPPERRKHFRALAGTLELRKLQAPEPLQHLLYTHPYAHRPLVEFMFSIPAEVVCGPGEPRRLMRRAFEALWPPELRRRRSKGSFAGVFLDSLRPLARELLEERGLQVVERGYLEPASLKQRLVKLTQSLNCNEPQLRHVILFELWLRARFPTSPVNSAPSEFRMPDSALTLQ
jgi:asparagine synthase (glutamine-hydrolysing)